MKYNNITFETSTSTEIQVRVQGVQTHLVRFTAAQEGVDDGDACVQRRHAVAGLVIPVNHGVV